jgi:hypothetical protein
MKPIKQNKFSSTISGVKLYIDDIELILSKLSTINENYTIFDDENIYEDLDELKKYKGFNPSIIKIESKSENDGFNFIYIRILENIASIRSYGENQNRIAYEIEKIFFKRKINPFIRFFFNSKNAIFNITLLTPILAIIYVYRTYYLKENISVKQNLWPLIIWLIILFLALLNKNTNGKIELKRRHESNFMKNNSDAILLVIITAILTAVITYLIS